MDEQTDKVIPSCTTMSDSNPDQETPVVLNTLTGLDSLLSITCYISTRTARTDVLNVFYVLSKDVLRLNSSIRRQQHGMIYQP